MILNSTKISAIRGAGAFRRFRDTIHRLGIQDHWYAHRRTALEKIGVDWLEEYQISYTREDDPGVAE